mgnify:CR=1 FL=1
MLISNNEAERRLNNPLNLITKMREGLRPKQRSAMDLFIRREEQASPNELKSQSGLVSQVPPPESKSEQLSIPPPAFNPFQESQEQVEVSIDSASVAIPSVGDLMGDIDADIALANTHNKALKLMSTAMDTLERKVEAVKADKLPAVISSLGKVVTDIRRERTEREKNGRGVETVHYHFYCPTQRKVDEYKVIEVA